MGMSYQPPINNIPVYAPILDEARRLRREAHEERGTGHLCSPDMMRHCETDGVAPGSANEYWYRQALGNWRRAMIQ